MSLKLFDLSGRVAVVMGGTSGIGRTIAIGLASVGADVVATGRKKSLICEVAAEIEKLGRRTVRKIIDAADRESIDHLRDTVLETLGSVDILVNCAGQTFRKPTQDMSESEWNDLLDVN